LFLLSPYFCDGIALFFSREEEEEIKADDLAEQAAKDEDANIIVLPLCFLLRV